jgi:TetR/AcrR family transcriptional regulator, lmrAB and yxaGH operons repressor
MSAPPKHRDAIVQAAATLFRRNGFAATGINEIVKFSGAPKGSLYHYFPNGKDEIAVAAICFSGNALKATLEKLGQKHKSTAALIRAYCQLLASWMAKSGFRDGCPITTTLLESAPQSAGVAAAGREAFDGWCAVIARALVLDGFGKAEAMQLATLTISALEGALILARIESSARPINDVAKSLAKFLQTGPPARKRIAP